MVQPPTIQKHQWNPAAFTDAFEVINTGSLAFVEMVFGDACQLVIGCLRALFVAAPGHDLMASDFSAIEGVVTAALAGEEWRLDVFRRGEDIYLESASRITGIAVEVYKEHKRRTGKHHPHRQPFGKVAELSSGYGGWIGAWLQFGADEFFTEAEIKTHVLAWRAASPWIVELWGGQVRLDKSREWSDRWTFKPEYFGLEGMAIQAVLNPGRSFTYRAPHPLAQPITYLMRGDVLYCILPSGRALTYHAPRIRAGSQGLYKDGVTLSYEGWNTNPKNGGFGWVRMDTYGGKLTENVVQAVARDILAFAIINLMRAGYPVVLHVHDEIVAEIIKTFGTVEEFETIMARMPVWAQGWPLRAAGGWRGWRYRKD
jgi:DNA polymerase